MNEKLLIGIHHISDEQAVHDVRGVLNSHQPRIVGLELPQNYPEYKPQGGIIGFNGLERFFVDSYSARIIPLDDDDFRKQRYFLSIAHGIQQKGGVNDFYKDKKALEDLSRYRAPEESMKLQSDLEMYEKVERYLQAFPTLARIQRALNDINNQSEQRILDRIFHHDPDIIVLGLGHTIELCKRLPMYKHVAIECN